MTLEIAVDMLDDLARGAAVLGTGGGGDPYIGRLYTQEAVRRHGAPSILALDDVKDDMFVASVAGFGAPTVQIEKLIRGDEVEFTFRRLERHLGRSIDAILPAEIGGSNSMLPLMLGARLGLPVIDADGMGRAFPELQMNSLSVHGMRAAPLVVADEHLNSAVSEAGDDRTAERLTRALAIQMGLRVFIAGFSGTGRQVKEAAIGGTLSIALGIGRAITRGRREGSPVESLLQYLSTTEHYRHTRLIFDGKIVDLERSTHKGFSGGTCSLEALDGGTSRASVVFQNENLVVRVDGQMRAIVPDLICIIDRETAEPIPTQSLKYGQRVAVIGLSAPAKMRTRAALECFGPEAFQLPEKFVPIEHVQGHLMRPTEAMCS